MYVIFYKPKRGGMFMSDFISTPNPDEPEKFLIYPDFQLSFEGQSTLYGVIMDYKSKFERLFDTMDQIRDWRAPMWVAFSKERFHELAQAAKEPEQQQKFEKLSVVWTPEDNYELAKQLYKANLDILEQYAFAYADIRIREDSKKPNNASVITPLFNKLPDPISMELNLELEFESRFKTWYSAIQKLITKTEMLNLGELQSFNDIYACRFIVSSGVGTDLEHDYEGAERDCYKTMNVVIRHIYKLGGKLLDIKTVGKTSNLIWPEYEGKIKDYIENPKSNNYRGLHACFEIPIGNRKIKFEVQVLSFFMYYTNERDAPHFSHKLETKRELAFDPTLVRLQKFAAGYRNDGSLLVIDRGEGLLEPKALSAHKWYHKR